MSWGISWAAVGVAGLLWVVSLTPAGVTAGRSGPASTVTELQLGHHAATSGDGAVAVAVDPGILTVASPGPATVVVQARPGRQAEAIAAVEAAGGRVGKTLPLVEGFSAQVAVPLGSALTSSPAVRAVTLDRSIQFEEFSYDDTTTASNFARSTGATAAWAAGTLGAGVGVAVIDTGIAGMNDFAGRVVHGPDLSGEGTTIDSYGHGTVMAGLVGGSGADSAGNTTGAYTGVAPKATLVSVKAAGRNGVTDVSTMLEAMHWVSAYKDQYNIRVLNLSWGTTSTQSPSADPLNYAVQRLWQQGIVVVVAAGNSGPNSGTITKPGDDPTVITVGAFDDKADADPGNDAVSSWSSRGPTAHGVVKPDVIAPGRTLIAARAYGSYVEANNQKALISPSYVKGSGTSQAAAVTSGLAALMIAQRPSLTPDQVKHLLKSTASPISGATTGMQGAGRVRLDAAVKASADGAPVQQVTANGLGSLDASRGGRWVETDCNNDGTIDVIKGEITYRCQKWDPAAWTGTSWTGTSWTGTSWTGTSWTGTSWTGTSWTGTSWTGTSWTGGTWTGTSWTGTSWTGTSWTGTSWTGTSWTGTSWTGTSWTGTSWTTGLYGDDDEFLSAFWGDRPHRGQRLPGEPLHAVDLKPVVAPV